MISTINFKWSKKEQLRKFISVHPDRVWVDGDIVQNTSGVKTGKKFSGYVTSIPYGVYVVCTHKGEQYSFLKTTTGDFSVF